MENEHNEQDTLSQLEELLEQQQYEEIKQRLKAGQLLNIMSLSKFKLAVLIQAKKELENEHSQHIKEIDDELLRLIWCAASKLNENKILIFSYVYDNNYKEIIKCFEQNTEQNNSVIDYLKFFKKNNEMEVGMNSEKINNSQTQPVENIFPQKQEPLSLKTTMRRKR
jgi:hypothetical protein